MQTAQSRQTVFGVRIVPKGAHYVIEVIYQEDTKPAPVDPALFVAADLGEVLAYSPRINPVSPHGWSMAVLSRASISSTTSNTPIIRKSNKPTALLPPLERITTKRTAGSCTICTRLAVGSSIGWCKRDRAYHRQEPALKQEVEMGKRNNQNFVQIPHAKLIELLTYKAELVVSR